MRVLIVAKIIEILNSNKAFELLKYSKNSQTVMKRYDLTDISLSQFDVK